MVDHRHLTPQEIQLAYTSFLLPQIFYPLPFIKILQYLIKRIFRQTLKNILQTLHLNTHLPLALVHGGNRYFGLQIEDAHFLRGTLQLQFLIGHLNQQESTGKLLQISLDDLELILGLGHSPLQHPSDVTNENNPDKWIQSLCRFLYDCDSAVEVRGSRVVKPQRVNDYHIMQLEKSGGYLISSNRYVYGFNPQLWQTYLQPR